MTTENEQKIIEEVLKTVAEIELNSLKAKGLELNVDKIALMEIHREVVEKAISLTIQKMEEQHKKSSEDCEDKCKACGICFTCLGDSIQEDIQEQRKNEIIIDHTKDEHLLCCRKIKAEIQDEIAKQIFSEIEKTNFIYKTFGKYYTGYHGDADVTKQWKTIKSKFLKQNKEGKAE